MADRFCIRCGHHTSNDRPTDACDHQYKESSEFYFPCAFLYGDEVNWVIYSIEDDQKTVFVDTPSFSGSLQRLGTGGVVLKNIQLIFKKWPISDKQSLILHLKSTYNLNEAKIYQFLDVLDVLQDMVSQSADYWPFKEIHFNKDNCATITTLKSPFLNIADELGDMKIAEMISQVVLHGNWDARYNI